MDRLTAVCRQARGGLGRAYVLLAWVTLMAAIACGAAVAPTDRQMSPSPSLALLQGTVVVEPTCPVERIGSPCPPAPLRGAQVQAYRGNTLAAAAVTDSSGHYLMHLTRGQYLIKVANPSLPRLVTRQMVALAGDTVLNLSVDSGMR